MSFPESRFLRSVIIWPALENTLSEFIATSYRCFWDLIARDFHHLSGQVSFETVGSLLKVCRAMIYSAAVEACPALTIKTSSCEPHKLTCSDMTASQGLRCYLYLLIEIQQPARPNLSRLQFCSQLVEDRQVKYTFSWNAGHNMWQLRWVWLDQVL